MGNANIPAIRTGSEPLQVQWNQFEGPLRPHALLQDEAERPDVRARRRVCANPIFNLQFAQIFGIVSK
jgi:hypothetical protein